MARDALFCIELRMPEIFDSQVTKREGSPEQVELLWTAYVSALTTLGLTDASPAERLALVEIVQEVGSVEVFRKPEHVAKIAVDIYRARRG